jgi:pimeloyl-ACP methyl ester carboxylesterase
VVVEAGLGVSGASATGWGRVLDAVAPFARVCAYDRANLGRSDFAPRPRTAADAADDLARLLEGLGVAAPYVLVGHSFGGHVVRLHAHRHPERVAGLVLVDPSPPADLMDRMLAPLPPERRVEFWAYTSLNREGMEMQPSYEQVRAVRGLPDRPAVVLLAGQTTRESLPWFPYEEAQRAYRAGMAALAAASPQAVERVAEQSQHDIPEQQPALVVDAIRDVIERARAAGSG